MANFGERLRKQVDLTPRVSDRELTDALLGPDKHPSQVNQEARLLERQGHLIRRTRTDGAIGNYPGSAISLVEPTVRPSIPRTPDGLSEDELKLHLEAWLLDNGWTTRIAWGKSRGVDIDAEHGEKRWLIEVKGLGSRQPMRVNYFIGALGETLQRMAHPDAQYSIALPDIPQFRRLWGRLPALAKERTRITALFVSANGKVSTDPPCGD